MIPISESRRRRNSRVFAKKGSSSRVFGGRRKICQRGGTGDGPGGQRACPPGRALEAPGPGVAPLGVPFGLLESSDVDIFLDFSEHFYFSPFSAMHG